MIWLVRTASAPEQRTDPPAWSTRAISATTGRWVADARGAGRDRARLTQQPAEQIQPMRADVGQGAAAGLLAPGAPVERPTVGRRLVGRLKPAVTDRLGRGQRPQPTRPHDLAQLLDD